MQKMKVYLDTSIINFLYADDAPIFQTETMNFFDTVLEKGKIDAYVSAVVTGEINDTQNKEKRAKLLATFDRYPMIRTLSTGTDEIAANITLLSDAYMKLSIIPYSKIADALHVAYATVFQMDVLLSWNFKHLANINKEQKILIVNKSYGFNYPFRMANPLEVQFDE
jgi:rRNA-processing protein FCF1